MRGFLKQYIQDFVDDIIWFLINPSYKNLKNVVRYFSVSFYKRQKIEAEYWKDKDIYNSHADEF